jgi:hypothetical protein
MLLSAPCAANPPSSGKLRVDTCEKRRSRPVEPKLALHFDRLAERDRISENPAVLACEPAPIALRILPGYDIEEICNADDAAAIDLGSGWCMEPMLIPETFEVS